MQDAGHQVIEQEAFISHELSKVCAVWRGCIHVWKGTNNSSPRNSKRHHSSEMENAMQVRPLSILAVAVLAIGTIHAQTVSGVVSTHACGRTSTPTYCYGIPFTINTGSGFANGSLWLDQASNGTGFIQFLNGSGLGQASIVNTPYQPTNGAPLSYSFTGSGYSGKLTLTYSRYYVSNGGIGTPGWRWIVTGGTINITLGGSGLVAHPMYPNHCYVQMFAIDQIGPLYFWGIRTWDLCLNEERAFLPLLEVG